MRELLLRPSLSNAPATVGLYSYNWILLPGFFLGPLPVIVYGSLNSWRLKRSVDAIAYLFALIGVAGLMYWATMQPRPDSLHKFVELTGSASPLFTVMRLYAMLLWGAFFLMHRSQFRAAAMLGDHPPSWRACLLACAIGVPLTYGLAAVVDHLRIAA